MLCEEGGISRLPYPAVRRWTDRVKRIPGFTIMAGIFTADPPTESL
jgi:glutathione S-transferase